MAQVAELTATSFIHIMARGPEVSCARLHEQRILHVRKTSGPAPVSSERPHALVSPDEPAER